MNSFYNPKRLIIRRKTYSTMDKRTDQQQETAISGARKPDESIIFGSKPVSLKCPFCLQQTNSQIIAKPQLASVFLGFLLFSVVPNILMLFLIIGVLQVSATRKHRCPLCETQLGTDGKFLIFFTDDLYSLSIGGTGLIITKKIIVSSALIVLTAFVVFVRVKYTSQSYNWTNLTWEQLSVECPQGKISEVCVDKYEDSSVMNWKGFVMKIQDNRQSFRRYYSHAVSLYLKMVPSDKDQKLPDLMLTADSQVLYKVNDYLDQLKHGDQISFNATFKSMKRGKGVSESRHFHLIDLNRTGNFSPNVKIYVTEEQKQWFNHHVLKENLHKLRQEQNGQEKQAVKNEELLKLQNIQKKQQSQQANPH